MQISSTDILAILEQRFRHVDAKDIKADIPLADQGFDSLDMADIYVQVDKQYDIHIPTAAVGRLRSVLDIVQFVNELKAKAA